MQFFAHSEFSFGGDMFMALSLLLLRTEN